MKVKAFIFDLNGTMIDDMHYHAEAWYDILNNDLQAGLTWEQVKMEMYGKNEELLVRIFGKDHFSSERSRELSVEKEKRYQEAYLPNLSLIRGLQQFLEESKELNLQLAIGSAAIPFNIDFVLDNLNIRHFFNAIVSADDVATSKPHPETFLKCAQLLNVNPSACIVFEDAPKGVEAASDAGMKCIVLTTTHSKNEFLKYDNVIRYIENYEELNPADYLQIH